MQLSPKTSAFFPALIQKQQKLMIHMPELSKHPHRPCPHSAMLVVVEVGQGSIYTREDVALSVNGMNESWQLIILYQL